MDIEEKERLHNIVECNSYNLATGLDREGRGVCVCLSAGWGWGDQR